MSKLTDNHLYNIRNAVCAVTTPHAPFLVAEPTVGRVYEGIHIEWNDPPEHKPGTVARYEGNGMWWHPEIPSEQIDMYVYDYIRLLEDDKVPFLDGPTRTAKRLESNSAGIVEFKHTPDAPGSGLYDWQQAIQKLHVDREPKGKVIKVQGAKEVDHPTLKWHAIYAKAVELGGWEEGSALVFPSDDKREQFAAWYADNSPNCLTVRTVTKPPPVVNNPASLIEPTGFTSLKQLRMWHWRQVLHERDRERHFENLEQRTNNGKAKWDYRTAAQEHHQRANLHLSAVQVLNDVVPGTAEQDCAQADVQ